MEGVMVAADAHVLPGYAESLGRYQSGASSLFSNRYLIAAFISFVVAQSLKLVTTWYKEKRWDMKKLVSSGGMPSSHSATVMGLVTAVGLSEGTGGSIFAIALVLASIVMYDATGIRLQAGRQAEVLNQIVFELPPEHPLADTRPLREPLGHTPPQVVAGALLGCFLAYFLHQLSSSAYMSP
ncbi:hypothetical protein O6H91_14G025200 [Diphasiastrum complanatum]|uniref:Uncharacterized protein n=1 Tax=Diphasiastrum complanatum TaxID=34168 RepID=A0ACC2BNE1_DIPCM|nr:hypothetical protein O6H91_14G025200 [Diphasiastrum complanatum]